VRISVVIPTYQRRDQVVTSVRALEHQTFDDPFEVVVMVDGSTDGTAPALPSLATRFPLRVLEQANQGAAAARTAGGAVAS
jgi:glycosyltransferase involved in cell wall biosynthesis